MTRVGKRIRRRFDKLLKTLANENQSAFGNGRLDCCDLNRRKETPDKDKGDRS